MKPDTHAQLSPTTLLLHWVVGLTVIGLLMVGVYMSKTETYALYPLHKSVGVCLFLIAVVRVGWRWRNGWPEPVSQYARIEQWLSRLVFWILLLSSLLMPLSGFLYSSLGGHGVSVFGLELVAKNPDPITQQAVAHNKQLASLFHEIHEWLGNLLIVTVLLHICGALKHHLIDRDGTLKRMLGSRVP